MSRWWMVDVRSWTVWETRSSAKARAGSASGYAIPIVNKRHLSWHGIIGPLKLICVCDQRVFIGKYYHCSIAFTCRSINVSYA